MAEYALILGGIAIIVVAAILFLGPAIRGLFEDTGSSINQFPGT
jgi:Flp pilus assembly pilin Flp